MKTKKHPKAKLENYSKIFIQLGLVLALSISYVLIQNKTYAKDILVFEDNGLTMKNDDVEIIEIKRKEIKPPKEVIKKKIPPIINQEDNDADIEEHFFEGLDPDEPVSLDDFTEVKESEIFNSVDEVDFIVLEEAPLFPGCNGTNEERKECFSKKINKYINKKFNVDLATQLGLEPGIQKIYTIFKIDEQGNVTDIEAKAPHKELKLEAIRIIESLPKMKPGMQQGHPVKVRYGVPIIFKVE